METYRDLVAFWNNAYAQEEAEVEAVDLERDWENLAPSPKLFAAAASLGEKEKVLDYGCGSGWGGIIAAKSGCRHVLCVDVTENGVKAAKTNVKRFQTEDRITVRQIDETWLSGQEADSFDGFFCSNVLDVIPTAMTKTILAEAARVVKPGGTVILGLNYYMDPADAVAKGFTVKHENEIYIGGVLRLVSLTDEEWRGMIDPLFTVQSLEHFAWPLEAAERRRLFVLRRK